MTSLPYYHPSLLPRFNQQPPHALDDFKSIAKCCAQTLRFVYRSFVGGQAKKQSKNKLNFFCKAKHAGIFC